MEQHDKKIQDLRIIYKQTDKGFKPITVEWDKIPCSKCERRYHPTCPKPDCWNKDGKYMTY